jgi:hypothetical protein
VPRGLHGAQTRAQRPGEGGLQPRVDRGSPKGEDGAGAPGRVHRSAQPVELSILGAGDAHQAGVRADGREGDHPAHRRERDSSGDAERARGGQDRDDASAGQHRRQARRRQQVTPRAGVADLGHRGHHEDPRDCDGAEEQDLAPAPLRHEARDGEGERRNRERLAGPARGLEADEAAARRGDDRARAPARRQPHEPEPDRRRDDRARHGDRLDAALAQRRQREEPENDHPGLGADETRDGEQSPGPLATSREVAVGGAEDEDEEQRLRRAVERGAKEVGARGQEHGRDRSRHGPRDPRSEAGGERQRDHRARPHGRQPQQRRGAAQRRQRRDREDRERLEGRTAGRREVAARQLARPHHPRPCVVAEHARHEQRSRAERGGHDDDPSRGPVGADERCGRGHTMRAPL